MLSQALRHPELNKVNREAEESALPNPCVILNLIQDLTNVRAFPP